MRSLDGATISCQRFGADPAPHRHTQCIRLKLASSESFVQSRPCSHLGRIHTHTHTHNDDDGKSVFFCSFVSSASWESHTLNVCVCVCIIYVLVCSLRVCVRYFEWFPTHTHTGNKFEAVHKLCWLKSSFIFDANQKIFLSVLFLVDILRLVLCVVCSSYPYSSYFFWSTKVSLEKGIA